MKSEKNLGLCLLRMLMCYEVVLCHFWEDIGFLTVLAPFHRIRTYAVPVFMVMSFYLLQEKFIENNTTYLKNRLWRLVYPQIGWTIIYWIVYNIVERLYNINMTNGLSDLLLQMFTGHSPNLNSAMWYQIILILLTILFAGIFNFLDTKKGIYVICILTAIALTLQYTEINWNIFSRLRYELMYPLGRISEMIPYATIGFLISYYNIFNRIKKIKLAVGVCIIAFIGFCIKKLLPGVSGFGYSGIVGIMYAIFFVTIVLIIPFGKISLEIKKIVTVLSKYTLGIYCIHNMIGRYIKYVFGQIGLETGTFFMCIIIYVICYFICFWISKIPLKKAVQLVE